MRLSKIEVKNFKTFKDVSVEFNKSNLLIGSCAAGKSNFVEIFDFLKDISQDFDIAYRKHGGPYLKNLNLNSDEKQYLEHLRHIVECRGLRGINNENRRYSC